MALDKGVFMVANKSGGSSSKRKDWKRTGFILAFLAPTIISFCIYYLYPIITVFVTSFCKWDYTNIANPEFFGFKDMWSNYKYLFQTYPYFWEALKNSSAWALLAVVLQVPVATLVAMTLAQPIRGINIVRNIYVVPNMISSAAMGMIFLQVYSPLYGLVNPVVELFIPGFSENILLLRGPAFWAMTGAYIFFTGTTTLMILGNIKAIPEEIREAAIIDGVSGIKLDWYITLPMIKPAILSTILLVFGSAMGSYPVPHYLNLTTLSTKYISMNSKYTGEASILAIIMMVFGVLILGLNQMSLKSRKNYTTVTGKSGHLSKISVGKAGKYVIAIIFIIITFFTSIWPILLFALETFLPNPGDYSFLYTRDMANLTTKWWVTSENIKENGMYGQPGILYNSTIWHAFRGTLLLAVVCALIAGTIGTLIGYAVAKNRRSKWANYVNNVAFLPYLMPSIAVGAAFFILFSNEKINLFNTYTLLIIAGVVKYIPFASRSSLNSMLQLSNELEEAAIIQNTSWVKRMVRIIIPIQKSSIISGYLLPFMTCLRELSLFLLLCTQGFILSTTLDYFDEMGLYAFSSAINLILIVTILIFNTLVNKLTGATLDSGIGGN